MHRLKVDLYRHDPSSNHNKLKSERSDKHTSFVSANEAGGGLAVAPERTPNLPTPPPPPPPQVEPGGGAP